MNPTQLTGLVMFAASTAMCVRAASNSGTRAWRWLAIVSVGCLLEVALGLRHYLHDLVVYSIAPRGWFASRRPAQVLFIAVLMITFGMLLRSALKLWKTDRKAGLAAICLLAAVGLFLAEAISLHAIDGVLYRKYGPVMAIGWLWAVLAGIIVVTAARAYVPRRRTANPNRRPIK
jgi:hypothetical protein